jgi:hypothetical protein
MRLEDCVGRRPDTNYFRCAENFEMVHFKVLIFLKKYFISFNLFFLFKGWEKWRRGHWGWNVLHQCPYLHEHVHRTK